MQKLGWTERLGADGWIAGYGDFRSGTEVRAGRAECCPPLRCLDAEQRATERVNPGGLG